MIKAALFGASGYTGLEIVRLLAGHPDAEIAVLGSESYSSRYVYEQFPHLANVLNLKFDKLSVSALTKKGCDVLFCALPHCIAMKDMKAYLDSGVKVIDLSADFRIKDGKIFEKWYKQVHLSPGLLSSAVYGLPEINRNAIRKADLIANPGCYPTSIVLGLNPLLKRKLVIPDSIISDSKSGITGAGRNVKASYLFAECDEDFRAYSVESHRHIPEIEQELSLIYGNTVSITFTPHLIPAKRGILSTIYAIPADGVSVLDIEKAFIEEYSKEKFVRFRGNSEMPRTRDVIGTNFCDIGFHFDKRTNKIIIVSVIDNLGKGAASQAIQNMNIMFDLAEDTGLCGSAIFI